MSNEEQPEDQLPEQLRFLGRLVPELIQRSTQMRFDSGEELDRYAVMLYGSVIELANAVCRLLHIGEPTGTGTLTRSTMEAFIDLHNLIADDGYVRVMNARSHHEWLRSLQAAEEGNPYMVGLRQLPDFQEQLELHQNRLTALRNEGVVPLNVHQRFERANQMEFYHGAYAWLCSDSHNSIRGLHDRHLEIDVDRGITLHILRERDASDYLPILDVCIECCLAASRMVHARFGRGEAAVEDLSLEWADIRRRWFENRNEAVEVQAKEAPHA